MTQPLKLWKPRVAPVDISVPRNVTLIVPFNFKL
jgi:hypothetical protein